MSKRYTLIIIVVLAFTACREKPRAIRWNLMDSAPAQIWEECYPLGNGHLGMMPDGVLYKDKEVFDMIFGKIRKFVD